MISPILATLKFIIFLLQCFKTCTRSVELRSAVAASPNFNFHPKSWVTRRLPWCITFGMNFIIFSFKTEGPR